MLTEKKHKQKKVRKKVFGSKSLVGFMYYRMQLIQDDARFYFKIYIPKKSQVQYYPEA